MIILVTISLLLFIKVFNNNLNIEFKKGTKDQLL